MTALEPLGDLHQAVFDVLAPELEAEGIMLFDYVPEDAEPPYVTWGTAWLASRDLLNGVADRVWFQLDVWSQYRGYAEAERVAHRVTEVLRTRQLDVEGYGLVRVFREQVHLTRDPDNTIRRIAMTFYSPYVALLRA